MPKKLNVHDANEGIVVANHEKFEKFKCVVCGSEKLKRAGSRWKTCSEKCAETHRVKYNNDKRTATGRDWVPAQAPGAQVVQDEVEDEPVSPLFRICQFLGLKGSVKLTPEDIERIRALQADPTPMGDFEADGYTLDDAVKDVIEDSPTRKPEGLDDDEEAMIDEDREEFERNRISRLWT